VNECHRLTSASVLALAAACPALLSVNVRGTRITDDALEALASECPRLADLNLECCLAITDVGIEALGRGAVRAQLGNANRSSSGGVRSGSSSGNVGGGGTGSGLVLPRSGGGGGGLDPSFLARRLGPGAWTSSRSGSGAGSGLPSMAEEDGDSSMDDDDDDGTAPTLRSISVSGCVRITDQSIVSVAAACRRLARVDLSQVGGDLFTGMCERPLC
jgi:hypothetical protein